MGTPNTSSQTRSMGERVSSPTESRERQNAQFESTSVAKRVDNV